MSMLSEPRRKAKWSINPRGNLWANDEDKFGQKLLEKMGWERGKGLGAKQQGMIDPVTLKSKDDNKGIGFKGHDDTWIAHQDDFSAVLELLNKEHGSAGDDDDDNKQGHSETRGAKKSLEHTSKSSRKRVHYHKFTRGKDLSRYSAQDLDCILGSQAVVKKRKIKNEEESSKTPEDDTSSSDAVESDSVGKEEKSHGLVTINSGNISDYFAKKMAAKKAAATETGDSKDSAASGESAKPESDSMGKEEESNGLVTINGGSIHDYFARKMAEKRAALNGQRNSEATGKVVEKDADEERERSSSEETSKSDRKKSKKSKKNATEESLPVIIYESVSVDISTEVTVSVEEILKDGERKKKKKSKKGKSEPDSPPSPQCEEVEVSKEKKRKKKSRDDTSEPRVDEAVEGREAQSEKSGKKKRKKAEREESVEEPKVGKKSKKEKSDGNTEFKGSNIGSIKGYGL